MDHVTSHAEVCAGKQTYQDAAMAQQIAVRVRRRHHSNIQAYRCPSCRQWHLGSYLTRTDRRRGEN